MRNKLEKIERRRSLTEIPFFTQCTYRAKVKRTKVHIGKTKGTTNFYTADCCKKEEINERAMQIHFIH